MRGGARRGAAAGLLVLLSAGARAEDWPQWRGLHRDGVWSETGIPETFPPGGLQVSWRAPVGVGYSSPVVAQGLVYVLDSRPVRPQARERVHAFDAATGKPAWSHVYDVNYPDWGFDEKTPRGPTATPIVESGRVYTLGSLGHLHCLEARKGEVLWVRDLEKEHPAKELNCSASPLIEDGLLIVYTGAKPGASVQAFEKETGKEAWKALDEPPTYSSPIVIESGGTRQLIVWTGESVTALDPRTGKTRWRVPLQGPADYSVSTPVLKGDLLLIGGLMLKLDPARSAPSILWPESKAFSRRVLSNTSTALLAGDHLYSARSSGELVCLESLTGKQLWETDKVTGPGGGACIHLTANGGSALLFNDRGELIRARLTPEGYRELARSALIEPTLPFGGRKRAWSPPAYSDRRVFARSDRELVCGSLESR